MTHEISLPVHNTVEGIITRYKQGKGYGFIAVNGMENVFFHANAYRKVEFNTTHRYLEWEAHSPRPGGGIRNGRGVVFELAAGKDGKTCAFPWTFANEYEQACADQCDHESARV